MRKGDFLVRGKFSWLCSHHCLSPSEQGALSESLKWNCFFWCCKSYCFLPPTCTPAPKMNMPRYHRGFFFLFSSPHSPDKSKHSFNNLFKRDNDPKLLLWAHITQQASLVHLWNTESAGAYCLPSPGAAGCALKGNRWPTCLLPLSWLVHGLEPARKPFPGPLGKERSPGEAPLCPREKLHLPSKWAAFSPKSSVEWKLARFHPGLVCW